MADLNADEKRELVREELHRLVKARYISLDVAARIVNAHKKYYQHLPKVNQMKAEVEKPQPQKQEPQVTITAKTTTPIKTQETSTAYTKPKKIRTQKQVRDRNITWGLNLGVILLLLGGLVLATSTWETLGNWAKTGLIMAVSALFFGLAWFTSRILHIKKTAFAFLVLGSLFLPIVVVSAGYFGLFGDYLSFAGEGKYLFGAIGACAILPIYLFFAIKLTARLFIWLSYSTISIFVGFLLASFYLPADGFYLGIMVYNAVFILLYRSLKGNKRWSLFIQEFIPFIQANLILSTLLMLVFYDSDLLYSFNLLLTAVIYFSMIFITNHKSYHFVFTSMLIYGAYQVVENSILYGIGEIVYAFLGIIFLLIPRLMEDASRLKKAFQVTSAIVSSLAFLYISYQGLVLRMGEESFVLFIAYIIIALNFTYLAATVKKTLFLYLSPVFFISALYELALLGRDWFGYESMTLPFFLLVFVMYILIGCMIQLEFFTHVKNSTRDVNGFIMLVTLFIGIVESTKLEVSVMFLLISMLGILMKRYESRQRMHSIAPWLHSVALGLAVISIYQHFFQPVTWYGVERIAPLEIVCGSLFVFGVGYWWTFAKWEKFYQSSFYTAQLYYGIGILSTLVEDTDPIIRAMIILGSVGMAYLLYRNTNWVAIPYVMSSISLLFYFSFLIVLHTELSHFPAVLEWLELPVGAILLIGTGYLIGNKESTLRSSFYWVGQIYLPFALLFNLLLLGADALWAFLIATILYGITIKRVQTVWKKMLFLYAGCTTLWASILFVFVQLDWDRHAVLSFFIVSILLVGGWIIADDSWKKRIIYYFLPFSSIGMVTFIIVYPYDVLYFGMTIVYAVLILYVLHKMKWDVLSILPLYLAYSGVLNYSHEAYWMNYEVAIQAIFGILLVLFGKVLYASLYKRDKATFYMDWYTLLAVVSFLSLYQLNLDNLGYKLLPGIALAATLYFSRNRVPAISTRWMEFAAFVYLLQPYYAVLGHFELPPLFEREFYVLPWVMVAIVLRSFVMKDNKISYAIQWTILVIVALLLIQDGLASNTIYDALIIGGLSLASLISGMTFQMKSFFFVGAGVLLFNVFIQTKPYWGRLPWWGYLLIAGSVLIAIASYNEWQKQRNTEDSETLLSKWKRNFMERMKNWD